MKLHFVKFLTSRENEIEKKEEEAIITYFATTQLGRVQSHLSCSRPPPSIISPSPSPPVHQPASSVTQLPLRHVPGEQYSPAIPPPAVPLLPSFFIKLPKQQSVAAVVPS